MFWQYKIMIQKQTTDDIKRISVPISFHISGEKYEGIGVGGDLLNVGIATDNILRIAGPIDSLQRKSILLSLQIKFDSTESNKFFRLSVSSNPAGETNLTEIKRQTKILRGGIDDKYDAGITYTQFWGIPLHFLVTEDKYFYLNFHFDTIPVVTDFDIKEFFIRGLTEPQGSYEYKNIK